MFVYMLFELMLWPTRPRAVIRNKTTEFLRTAAVPARAALCAGLRRASRTRMVMRSRMTRVCQLEPVINVSENASSRVDRSSRSRERGSSGVLTVSSGSRPDVRFEQMGAVHHGVKALGGPSLIPPPPRVNPTCQDPPSRRFRCFSGGSCTGGSSGFWQQCVG